MRVRMDGSLRRRRLSLLLRLLFHLVELASAATSAATHILHLFFPFRKTDTKQKNRQPGLSH
jgi:hypothetical protein